MASHGIFHGPGCLFPAGYCFHSAAVWLGFRQFKWILAYLRVDSNKPFAGLSTFKGGHPDAEGNIRDHAPLEQLVVLTNLESLNSVLIRHILGIEVLESFPDTVSRSIDQFINEHPALTSHQLQFLGLLRDLLIDRGDIEKRDLIQSPFTIIYPSGIRGVFSPAQITEILALTDRLAA